MNIWELDKALLFIALVLPGFISIKVFSLAVATRDRDYSKSIVEAVCYSVLNFIILYPLIVYMDSEAFSVLGSLFQWAIPVVVLVIVPALWPFLFINLLKIRIIKKLFLNHISQPWDWVFSKRDAMWIEVYLKNGQVLRGKYGLNSYASRYPNERQIYIEEMWVPNRDRAFGRKLNRSEGFLVSEDEISYLKFSK